MGWGTSLWMNWNQKKRRDRSHAKSSPFRELLQILFYGNSATEEGCLSLEGVRPTRRWKSIKVQYETADGKPRIRTFTGWTAQIIQHEIDHCDGILI